MATRTLTKFDSKDVLYKKVLGKAADLNIGDMSNAVTKDAGPMIALNPLQKAIDEVKKEKPNAPVVHLGVFGGNLVFSVQGAEKYAYSEIVVKGYAKIKEDRKKATVINAQKGDDVIDSSSNKMAKAKGTDVKELGEADLKEVKGDIVILAHGSNVGNSPGAVYAKDFGHKKPKEIVTYLVKDKKLPKSFAGVVYLDGCYTAAGPKQGKSPDELRNFCASVYQGLKGEGYLKLQVKGNLGVAKTTTEGAEDVVDAQMEKEIEVKTKAVQKELKKLAQGIDEIQQKKLSLIEKKKKLTAAKREIASNAKFDDGKKQKLTAATDLEIKGIDTKDAELDRQYTALDNERKKWFAEKTKILEDLKKQGVSAEDIKDLVGTFGPEMS
jgi:hypothetical protein